MKKKAFISILLFLSLVTVTAAEQQPTKRPHSPSLVEAGNAKKRADLTALAPALPNHFHVEFSYGVALGNVPKDVLSNYITLQNMFDDLGDDSNEIVFVPNCSQEDFLALDTYRKQEKANRFACLKTLKKDELLSLIKTADYLKLSDTTDAYNMLMTYALSIFTAEELKEYFNILDRTALQKALKTLQLFLIANSDVAKRNLEHESNLGKEKVAFLKENSLWNIKISVLDLYNYPTTKHFFTPKMVRFANLEQKLGILLNDCYLTSLDGLTTIPGLDTLETLNLSNNQLTALHPTIFTPLTQLQRLNLTHNQLTTLDPALFSSLTQLQHLGLHNNQLTTLDPALFSSLTQLQGLGLAHNQLTALHPALFTSLAQLQMLGLSNNQLTALHPATFAPLAQLQALWLNNNCLTLLKTATFSHLIQLIQLNLSANKIKTWEPNAFFNLPALQLLTFKDNELVVKGAHIHQLSLNLPLTCVLKF